jgi:Tol biopolymer transport system component
MSSNHRRRRLGVLVGATVAVAALFALSTAGSARATFPGANGKIAFSTDQDPNGSNIVVVSPNGSGETQLTHGEFGNAFGPNWSPDGAKIAFSGDVSGIPQLYVINSDGSGGDPTHPLFDDPNNADVHPHYSPDGSQIAFQSCGAAGCTIDVIASDGSGGATVLTNPVWYADNPTWSPDGSKIAFESQQDGLLDAVWVMNANGSNPQRLTAAALEAGYPDWSPDGKHILFQDLCCQFGTNIWVMNADGSNQKQITHMPTKHQDGFAHYSPDGTKIVLIADLAYKPGSCGENGCSDLYTMNTNGTHMTKIVSDQPGVFISDWGRQP